MSLFPFLSNSTNGNSTYSLTIINASDEAICSIRLAESSSHPMFGRNKIGREALESGDGITIHKIGNGYYDVKGKTCNGRIIWDYDIPVVDDTEWVLTSETIRN